MTLGKIGQTALTNSNFLPIVSLTSRHSYSRGISITIIRKKYRRLILVTFVPHLTSKNTNFMFRLFSIQAHYEPLTEL